RLGGGDAPDLVHVLVEVARLLLADPLHRAHEPDVARPREGRPGGQVGGRVAGVAGLRVRLGDHGPGQEVDDRALARPGPTDDRDVQRPRRLAFEERADHVAGQRGGEPEVAGMGGQLRLAPAMVFQPAQVFGQPADGRAMVKCFHDTIIRYKWVAGPGEPRAERMRASCGVLPEPLTIQKYTIPVALGVGNGQEGQNVCVALLALLAPLTPSEQPGSTSAGEPAHDRKAGFAPVSGVRSSRNASSGTLVGRPSKSSAITWPVPIDSWTPARKCPAATNALSHPGTGPMNGSPSGEPGRNPAQHFST